MRTESPELQLKRSIVAKISREIRDRVKPDKLKELHIVQTVSGQLMVMADLAGNRFIRFRQVDGIFVNENTIGD